MDMTATFLKLFYIMKYPFKKTTTKNKTKKSTTYRQLVSSWSAKKSGQDVTEFILMRM